ncbi:hypothetical protein HJ114_13445 [Vibrio parahaemolyticus]|uniref:hypothetical protein n=1 Tax=Gammaproteobacteria TaxID=1236 RepID=UPI0003F87E83|nr:MULTISPECIES: hypothetical protein [Gammaproteobacteria]MBE4110246.1 hypothetical protein [Vibrio parahaemolyticus]MCF4175311.1 hypothetical protein [Vibrio sp. McD22-P3]
MISLPSIVLIDDNKEDLDILQDSFTRMGYPCFPIHYQGDDPANESGIDHVKLDMIKPRIVISDLNLQELQKVDEKQLAGPIAEVLHKLPLSGPFILYFWSRNAGTVDPVMQVIYERYTDIPHPIHWGVLDKTQFKSGQQDLAERITTITKESQVFDALCSWEGRVSTAAQKTTDSLFNLARATEHESLGEYKDKTTTKLQSMLSVIGNETLGVKNAAEEPDIAIELGLEPVLHDHIQSMYEQIEPSVWTDAANEIGKRIRADSDVKAYLNSFYHVEELDAEASNTKRGTWVEFEPTYMNNPDNAQKIKNHFGRKIKALLNEEFLNCDIGDSTERAEAHAATRLGFLELSAECDQAQRKTKLHRYFLSAMIPVEYERFTFFREQDKTKHSGIYRLPNIRVCEQEYIVKVTFMYQVGAIPDFNKWLGKPIFRLKDQILSDISFNAFQHAARPGIIRFD